MSNVVAAVEKTTTAGYYNPARWPIQLVISKLNLTLTLEPGQYILDRQKRKVNDPYFEVFVKNRQLQRETVTKEVPYILIPEVKPMETASARTSPVSTVTDWKRDGKGIKQPVLPPAPKVAVPSVSTDSVTPMTMDEARARGFIRRARNTIDDDVGIHDTNGLPPRNIPTIKYAIDSSMNKNVKPLPQSLLEVGADDPARNARRQLVTNLGVAGSTQQVENAQAILQGGDLAGGIPEAPSVPPFANTVTTESPDSNPLMSGTPGPAPEEPEPSVAEVTEAASENQAGAPTLDEVLPEPVMDEVIEEAAPASAPAQTAAPAPAPAPGPLVRPPALPTTPAASTEAFKFVCPICGDKNRFRQGLVKHAKEKHKDQVAQVMANYPG